MFSLNFKDVISFYFVILSFLICHEIKADERSRFLDIVASLKSDDIDSKYSSPIKDNQNRSYFEWRDNGKGEISSPAISSKRLDFYKDQISDFGFSKSGDISFAGESPSQAGAYRIWLKKDAVTRRETEFLAKGVGHTFDMDGTFSSNSGDIKLSGWDDKVAKRHLLLNFEDYATFKKLSGEQIPTEIIDQEKEKIAYMKSLSIVTDRQHKQNVDTSLVIQRWKEGKITPVITGWQGHSLTVQLQGDAIAIINRGERGSDVQGGITIFKLDPNQMKDEEKMKELVAKLAIQSINPPPEGSVKDKDPIKKILDDYTDKNTPAVVISHPDQIAGNCTYANSESTVFLDFLVLGLKEKGQVPSLFDALKIMNEKDINVLKSSYNRFLQEMRDVNIDRLLRRFKEANNSGEKNIKDDIFNLLVKIGSVNNNNGLRRGVKIYEELNKMDMQLGDKYAAEMGKIHLSFRKERYDDLNKKTVQSIIDIFNIIKKDAKSVVDECNKVKNVDKIKGLNLDADHELALRDLLKNVKTDPYMIEKRLENFDPKTKIASGPLKYITLKFKTEKEMKDVFNNLGTLRDIVPPIDGYGTARDSSYYIHLEGDKILPYRIDPGYYGAHKGMTLLPGLDEQQKDKLLRILYLTKYSHTSIEERHQKYDPKTKTSSGPLTSITVKFNDKNKLENFKKSLPLSEQEKNKIDSGNAIDGSFYIHLPPKIID